MEIRLKETSDVLQHTPHYIMSPVYTQAIRAQTKYLYVFFHPVVKVAQPEHMLKLIGDVKQVQMLLS